MCLASVYGKQNDVETLIMKNVTKILTEEGKVYLYDIIGRRQWWREFSPWLI